MTGSERRTAMIKDCHDHCYTTVHQECYEHIAANALYQIEVNHVEKVEYTREMVEELLK